MNQNSARDRMSGGVKFITPVITDGHVYVGTSGELQVFSLLAPPTEPPVAPTDPLAVAENALQIQLTEDYVFYFGNFIGDTGAGGNTAVDSADELATRNNLTESGAAGISNVYDFNRDKQVDSEDVLVARTHRSGLFPLKLITAPALSPASAAIALSPSPTTVSVSSDLSSSESPSVPASGLSSSWLVGLDLTSSPHPAQASAVDQALADFVAEGRQLRLERLSFRPTPSAHAPRIDSESLHAPRDSSGSTTDTENQAQGSEASVSIANQIRTALRQFRRVLPVWLLLACCATQVRAADIVVGTHLLSANTPNQMVQIYVSGDHAIAGEDIFAQIGDGGTFVGGSDAKPSFVAVDILSGTVLGGNNNGAFGDPGPGGNAAHPLIWVDGTTTTAGTVDANGLLATLTVDTTGLSGGTFPLLLTGVAPSLGGFDTTLRDSAGGLSSLFSREMAQTDNISRLTTRSLQVRFAIFRAFALSVCVFLGRGQDIGEAAKLFGVAPSSELRVASWVARINPQLATHNFLEF